VVNDESILSSANQSKAAAFSRDFTDRIAAELIRIQPNTLNGVSSDLLNHSEFAHKRCE